MICPFLKLSKNIDKKVSAFCMLSQGMRRRAALRAVALLQWRAMENVEKGVRLHHIFHSTTAKDAEFLSVWKKQA
jgi:hypothetical protein